MRLEGLCGLFTLSAVLFLAPAVPAQTPAGPEFLVHAATTEGSLSLAVSMDQAGAFVVAWRDFDDRVSARWFTARAIALGSERQMSVVSPFNAPSVAADRRSSLVAWSRPPVLEGAVFKPDSQPIGAEFQVSSGEYALVNFPALAAVPSGFVVAWVRTQPPNLGTVLGRRYDRAGQSIGTEFVISAATVGAAAPASVAATPLGDFVAVWQVGHLDGTADIVGQLMSASGTPRGAQFRVNEFTTGTRGRPDVAADDLGNFVVIWKDLMGAESIKARRFTASGSALGGEFVVNTFPSPFNYAAAVAADAAGNFTVVWEQGNGIDLDVSGRRFIAAGTPRGPVFNVNTYTSSPQRDVAIADDGHGNFIVAWDSNHLLPDGVSRAFARRYGGLAPVALSVTAGGNGVLEPNENFQLTTAWSNFTGASQTFQGHASSVVAPSLAMSIVGDAAYGPIADNATGACSPCFSGNLNGTRPPGHIDARFVETVVPDALGQVQRWTLHIGDSFTDVPRAGAFYRFVETVLHRGVTAGCGITSYCPTASTTREQMAPFVLVAREGPGYAPPACGTPLFGDVPAASPFCRWIEELARRGVVGGCAPGLYCPTAPVTREQMAVFVLRTLDPALNPPACTTPVFADVPASSAFCRWIEELARRGVVTGCGGGNYCPGAPVTREQMSVFLSATFGLTLYGP